MSKFQKSIAFVIDSLPSLNPKKDSSLAMMEAAQKRNWEVCAITLSDMYVDFSIPMAHVQHVEIDRKKTPFWKVLSEETRKLESFDFVLMRKDPPLNMEYIYAASALSLLDPRKTIVSNKPQSLRAFNEKFLVNMFPQFMAPTLFSRNANHIREFLSNQGKCVVKPMDVMGGQGVFVINEKDSNRNVILETLTERFTKTIVVQKYIPEISEGDRRVVIIGGKPCHHVMIRKPSSSDHRGNLAAGATAEFGEITSHERDVVAALQPFIMEHGLHLVGLDMIGKHITEINFTSPTCLVEIGHYANISLENSYLDYLESI